MDGSGAEQSPAKTIPGTAGVWPRAAVTSIGARPNQRSELSQGAREGPGGQGHTGETCGLALIGVQDVDVCPTPSSTVSGRGLVEGWLSKASVVGAPGWLGWITGGRGSTAAICSWSIACAGTFLVNR
jgi:hypothetical protein